MDIHIGLSVLTSHMQDWGFLEKDELEKWHHTISRSLSCVGQITKILEQHWKLLIIVIYKAYGAHRIKGLPPQWTGALQTFEVNPLFKIKLHYLFCKELNATEILSSYPEYRHTWNYYYSILTVKSDFTHLHRFTDIETFWVCDKPW